KKEDGRIDWAKPARQIYNRMRGFTPWPGSYTTFRGQMCNLWGHPGASSAEVTRVTPGDIVETPQKEVYVVCGERTLLQVKQLQIEGRKKLSAREFANGARLSPSERFV
ncbi:MAG TPA: hypothetical protein VGI34_09180, partial [Candidatus Acidoferrales bacterium]